MTTLAPAGQAPALPPQTVELLERQRSDIALWKGLAIFAGVVAIGLAVYAVTQRLLATTRIQLAQGEAYREIVSGPRGRTAVPPPRVPYPPPPPPSYGYTPYGY